MTGTVWTGRYPVAGGGGRGDVVVRVRSEGWTTVEFDIEHSYGGPVGVGRGALPSAVFARRFDRIF